MVILTSCRLISWVEKVPFWWMSSISDHSVLFLLLGGVGAAVLPDAFWGLPGNLPSPRNEAYGWERGHQTCKVVVRQEYPISLAKFKSVWFLLNMSDQEWMCAEHQRPNHKSSAYICEGGTNCGIFLPGWFDRSAGRPHSSLVRWGWLMRSLCQEDGHACCWVPEKQERLTPEISEAVLW